MILKIANSNCGIISTDDIDSSCLPRKINFSFTDYKNDLYRNIIYTIVIYE